MGFYTGMKVAVIGGAGMIGSFLVELLEEEGADVTVLDNLSRGRKSNLSGTRCQFIYTDASVLTNLGPLKGAKAVFNLAAKVTGMHYNRKHHAEMFYKNMMLQIAPLRASVMWEVPLYCCVSTVCVYPHDMSFPVSEEEGHQGEPEPTNAGYGWAKRMGERYARWVAQEYGIKVGITRFSNCFSKDTDVMTADGARNIRDIRVGDPVYTLNPNNHEVEVGTVIATQQVTTDEFFNFRDKSVDFRVTPDHTMYYRSTTAYQKKPAEFFRERAGRDTGQINLAMHKPVGGPELGDPHVCLHAFIDGDHTYHTGRDTVQDTPHHRSQEFPCSYRLRDWVRFLGWFITEGDIALIPTHGKNPSWQIRITQYKDASPDTYSEIRGLLEGMGIPYGCNGRTFYFSSRMIGKYLEETVGRGARNKRIPQFVLGLDFPPSLRLLLFQTMMKGDGNKSGRRYTTSSDGLKDDFMHLCFLLGYKTVASHDGHCWRISISKTGSRVIKYRNISVEQVEKEEAYDITVDRNHIIYAGRDNRLNWVGQCFGPRDYFDEETSHVIPALIRRTVEDDFVKVYGTGLQSREFLYARDAAMGMMRVLEHYHEADPVNIGNPENRITIGDLAYLIQEVVGVKKTVYFDTSIPDGYPKRGSRIDKLVEKTGWQPQTTLREGLKETVAWYLDMGQ